MIYELSQPKVGSINYRIYLSLFYLGCKVTPYYFPSWALFNESGFESEISIILQGRDYIGLHKAGKGYRNQEAFWKLVSFLFRGNG